MTLAAGLTGEVDPGNSNNTPVPIAPAGGKRKRMDGVMMGGDVGSAR